jgi:hypothetical protein
MVTTAIIFASFIVEIGMTVTAKGFFPYPHFKIVRALHKVHLIFGVTITLLLFF